MASKTWKKTRVQFLWQHVHYGTYYARLFRDGKEHWKSLKTDVFSVTQAKLAAHLKDFRGRAPADTTGEIERGMSLRRVRPRRRSRKLALPPGLNGSSTTT
jgi:hypothetical protein